MKQLCDAAIIIVSIVLYYALVYNYVYSLLCPLFVLYYALVYNYVYSLLYYAPVYITKYGSTLYIGMDKVLAHYACTFENSNLHFHFQ